MCVGVRERDRQTWINEEKERERQRERERERERERQTDRQKWINGEIEGLQDD